MPAKSKLTLSVDSDTVAKAKSLGINISEITETVLRTFTYPKDESRYETRKGYEALFTAMMPLLKQYGASMSIGTAGEVPEDVGSGIPLYLDGYGYRLEDDPDEMSRSLDEIETQLPFTTFSPPDVLLKEFIEALSSAKEMRKEHIRSLELARRIVEAITKDTTRKVVKRSATKTQKPRRVDKIA